MEENNKSQKEKLRLWLLDNPGINPYRFSFDKLFRILTNSQRLLPDFIIIGNSFGERLSLKADSLFAEISGACFDLPCSTL